MLYNHHLTFILKLLRLRCFRRSLTQKKTNSMKEILILILALPVLLFYKETNDDNSYYEDSAAPRKTPIFEQDYNN